MPKISGLIDARTPSPKKRLSFATREKQRMAKEFDAVHLLLLREGGYRHVDGELRLCLTMPVNLANARLHWRSKDMLRREYFHHCDYLLRGGCLPTPPGLPMPRAAIEVEMYCKREMDADNAMHRAGKWPLDWLQVRGYILSDKPSCLQWVGMPKQHPSAKVPRLVITLREVTP